jgi:hypothetical protein
MKARLKPAEAEVIQWDGQVGRICDIREFLGGVTQASCCLATGVLSVAGYTLELDQWLVREPREGMRVRVLSDAAFRRRWEVVP